MNAKTKYTASAKYHCLEFLKRNSMELYLNYCRKESCEPGHTYGPASRSEYLLHYILDGSGTFQHGETTYTLKKHDAFLIFPDEVTTYSASLTSPWSYIWLGFNGPKALDCLQHAGFSDKKRVGHFPQEETITGCVDQILGAHQLTYCHDLIRQSNLMLLLACMIQEFQENSADSQETSYPQNVYVEYAIDYIDQNMGENIKISDIASYVGIDRSYLTKVFKKTMDLSPQEYLVNVRMNKAASLLTATSLPMHQISEQVGYNNPLAFSKAFKQKFGASPTNYRTLEMEGVILSDHKEPVS